MKLCEICIGEEGGLNFQLTVMVGINRERYDLSDQDIKDLTQTATQGAAKLIRASLRGR